MERLRLHLRSNFVSYVALAVALIGVPTAWALARNTVGTSQLKPGAVKTVDIGFGAVTSPKVADGTLRRRDFASGQLDTSIDGIRAGGDLRGTYPNPTIAPGAVGAGKLADASVGPAKLGPQLVAQAGAVNNQSIPSGMETTVVFDEPESERLTFDVGGLYDPASPSKFTAPRAGIYEVAAGLNWDANATGFRELRIQQDFASGGLFNTPVARSDAGTASLVQFGAVKFEAVAGDEFIVRVRQTSGGALDLNAVTASIQWLGPVS